MTTEENPNENPYSEYRTNRQLMIEIAEMAGLENYDPDRAGENTSYSRFTKEERRKIYETLTGKPGNKFLRKQLPEAILNEIGEELHSNFRDEFSRPDLKKIHQELANHQS